MNDVTTLKLKPGLLKNFLIIVACIPFVLFGVLMIFSNQLFGWVVVGFFGLGIGVLLRRTLSGNFYLLLNSNGFTVEDPVKSYTYNWKDVQEFVAAHPAEKTLPGLDSRKLVFFNLTDSFKQQTKLELVNRELNGFDSYLPDTYGKKAEELANLLNAWHKRFVEQA